MTDITTRLRNMAAVVDADVGADTDDLIQTLRDGADATASLLEALEKLDASWSTDFPGGPDGDTAWLGGIGRLSEETAILWREIRAAIASARGQER